MPLSAITAGVEMLIGDCEEGKMQPHQEDVVKDLFFGCKQLRSILDNGSLGNSAVVRDAPQSSILRRMKRLESRSTMYKAALSCVCSTCDVAHSASDELAEGYCPLVRSVCEAEFY